jgi:hypothetical protein
MSITVMWFVAMVQVGIIAMGPVSRAPQDLADLDL